MVTRLVSRSGRHCRVEGRLHSLALSLLDANTLMGSCLPQAGLYAPGGPAFSNVNQCKLFVTVVKLCFTTKPCSSRRAHLNVTSLCGQLQHTIWATTCTPLRTPSDLSKTIVKLCFSTHGACETHALLERACCCSSAHSVTKF